MRIVNVVALILLTMPRIVLAQAETPALWSNTYGSADDEVASHLVLSIDGSISVNAQKTIYQDESRNLFSSHSDAWIFGLTPRGEMTWQKTLGGTGSDTFYAANAGPDSELLLCGSTDSDLEKIGIWAMLTDAQGRIRQQKVIPGDDDMAVMGGSSVGGKMFVCGQEWAGVEKKWQAFVVALTPEFDVDWRLSIGDDKFDAMNQVVGFDDGKLLALGRIGTANGFDDLLMLLDSDGKELWRKVIPRTEGQSRSTLVATDDGGFVTLGQQQKEAGSALLIQKFDLSGEQQWQQQFSSAHAESATNAAVLSDGSILIAGSRESDFPDGRRKFNAVVFKLAKNGTLNWRRSFPTDGHSHIYCMDQLANGQIVAVGSLMPADTKNADAWVFTFTPDGEFPESVDIERE